MTNTNQSGPGSLRQAFIDANAGVGPDTIVLQASTTYAITDCGAIDEDGNGGGDLDSTGDLAISGNGSTIQNTCVGDRVIDQDVAEPLTITDLTITGGEEDDNGGGINAEGEVTLTPVTISGNRADGRGGGLYLEEDFEITNSTISGNSAVQGGGIYDTNDLFTGTYVTIASNEATDGANIHLFDGNLQWFGVVIADPIGGVNCFDIGTPALPAATATKRPPTPVASSRPPTSTTLPTPSSVPSPTTAGARPRSFPRPRAR